MLENNQCRSLAGARPRQTMARRLRAIIKAVAFSALTGSCYLLWLAGFPFVAAFGRAARRWRNFAFRRWARATAWLLGMRLDVRGAPPQAPFFLVANHLSYLDIVAFAARLDCVFVAKSEVARWPVLGWICRSMGTIFVDRNHRHDLPRVAALIEQALQRGQGVMLFAEGTSTDGARVAPFKPGLLEPAARAGYPVAHASISYRTPPREAPARLALCWWGEMAFLDHLFGVFHLPEFYATLVFGSQPIQEEDRKELARKLRAAVQSHFIPVS
jgi:1-acyl-sn-glycerol-3-phosphate acyltransferase